MPTFFGKSSGIVTDAVVPFDGSVSENSEETDANSFGLMSYSEAMDVLASITARPDGLVRHKLKVISKYVCYLVFYGLVLSCPFMFAFPILMATRSNGGNSIFGSGFVRGDWRPAMTCQKWMNLTRCVHGESRTILGTLHDDRRLFFSRPFVIISLVISQCTCVTAVFAESDGISPLFFIFHVFVVCAYVWVWAFDPGRFRADAPCGIITVLTICVISVQNFRKSLETKIVSGCRGGFVGVLAVFMSCAGGLLLVFLAYAQKRNLNPIVVLVAGDFVEGAIGVALLFVLYDPSLEKMPEEARWCCTLFNEILCEQAMKDYVLGLDTTTDVVLGSVGKTFVFVIRRVAMIVLFSKKYREGRKRTMLLTGVVTSMSAEIVTLSVAGLRAGCLEPGYFRIAPPTLPMRGDHLLVSFAVQLACVLSSFSLIAYVGVKVWRHAGGESLDLFPHGSRYGSWRIATSMLASSLLAATTAGYKLRVECLSCGDTFSECFVC
eukprot:TRINITY_DN28463_c0_g1_i1.p1 TRINITY_DN28463_c0_g1~~TRINITY_DN28463_c0_g1_i1.p1  ORF type:complete len:493 (+),score=50.81 TRINITY_DN28463_c0_g1_i1:47-1525(+)